MENVPELERRLASQRLFEAARLALTFLAEAQDGVMEARTSPSVDGADFIAEDHKK